MALYRILVVDDSPAVRETVGILLGNDYEVHASRVDDFLAAAGRGPVPHLVIAAPSVFTAHPQQLPSGVPVLWIGDGAVPALGTAALSPRFSPRELRRRVAELLGGAPVAEHAPPPPRRDPRLDEPFLPAAAARTVQYALTTDLPLHLVGESGTGKRFLAKTLHVARGKGPFLALPGAYFDPAVLTTAGGPGGTLFIDRVDQLDAPSQQLLLGALDPSGLVRTDDGKRLRLLTASTADLEAAVDEDRFSAALFYRLTVLRAYLPPLRERSADIPALARLIGGELGQLLGRPHVEFTAGALERLGNYLWFGNLAELEAVLARTIALAPQATIDADALLFDSARLEAPPAAVASPRRDGATLGGRSLDLIINELAHEFKNPLVTIKTFAHHLRRALPKGGEDDQVARLTGEAVQQIDQTLENLLEFTRMETPVPQSVPLSAVLGPVFAEFARVLANGPATDQTTLPRVAVRGDPQQLAYALTNLLRSLTRDLPPKSRLTVRYIAPTTIAIVLPDGAEPFGNHLATLLDRPPDGSPAIPLGVAIANAVLERNGATVAVADDTPSTIIVRFTAADEEAVVAGNGTSPRVSR